MPTSTSCPRAANRCWRRCYCRCSHGFSELYAKESDEPEVSGYGFELTFRLAIAPDTAADAEPPRWAMNFLQNLARYVFQSGNVFKDGDWMTANGPIALERPRRSAPWAL